MYGCAISQKLPVNGFEWEEKIHNFNEYFTKNSDEDSNKRCFLEVDVEYPKIVFNLHSDLPFLPEQNKIKKCNKLICNKYDKENYVVYMRVPKQALNIGLKLKQCIKSRSKKLFWKDLFKLMNNVVSEKTIENVRRHRVINLATTEKWRNQLGSEPNYHTIKYFSENLMAI